VDGQAVTLDLKSGAAVQRWVEQAPPLSEKQKDLIAAAFSGALNESPATF
jgi:hypothetical protein